MTRIRSCPKCGNQLTDSGSKGLCPVCTARLISSLDPASANADNEPLSGGALRGGVGGLPRSPAEGRPVDGPTQLTGKRLGDYELRDEIARGGMGVVYRARQISLNRIVAVKLLLAGPYASQNSINRFRLEAEAAAGLQHPNIVPIYEVGDHEGQHFFAMAYVEGRNLHDIVQEGTVPERHAAAWIKTMAEAIHYAHQRGIIHRDLKPSNVLVENNGTLRITDFGLAQQLECPANLTVTGEFFGSPNYMPPEQAFGRRGEVGVRGDVYSLGAILYHLMTGRPPFAGVTLEQTLQRVAHEDPIPSRVFCPAIPVDLETICLKCLEKNPSQRFGSAQELADELGRFLAGEPISSRPVTNFERVRRWCGRNPVVAGLGMVSVILLLVVAIASPIALIQIQQQRKRADLNAEQSRRYAWDSFRKAAEGRQRLVRLNVANGNRLVTEGDLLSALPWYVEAWRLEREQTGRSEIHRQRIESLLVRLPRLAHLLVQERRAGEANYGKLQETRFSSDGTRIATSGAVSNGTGGIQGQVIVWNTKTGQPDFPPLTQPGDIFYLEFSADGSLLATASGRAQDGASVDGEVRVWNAATGAPLCSVPHDGIAFHANFAFDNSQLVTATRRFNLEGSLESKVYVWELPSGKPAAPPLVHQGEVWGAWFDRKRNETVTAEVRRLGRDGPVEFYMWLWDMTTGRPKRPALRTEGFTRATRFTPDTVWTLGIETGLARVWDMRTGELIGAPLRHGAPVVDGAFNRDGTRVVTAGMDNAARIWELASGSPLTPPLPHGQAVCNAQFSPNNQQVATASFDYTARLWDAKDGRPVSPPLHHSEVVRDLNFSPAGDLLLTTSSDQISRLWNLKAKTWSPISFAHRDVVWNACFSSDGRQVLTVSEDGTARVWDSRTGNPVVPPLAHRGPVVSGCFALGGRMVATASHDGTAMVWDAVTGKPVGKPLQHPWPVWHVAFSHDGRRLITSGGPGHFRYYHMKGQAKPAGLNETAALGSANDGESRIWNVGSMTPELPAFQHEDAALQAEFSPDDQRVVTLSLDRTARLWNASTGEASPLRIKPGGWIFSGGISRDGSRVAVAGGDTRGMRLSAAALVCDTAHGHPITPPLPHPDVISAINFSPDSTRVVTACWDGAARIWNATTGRLVCPPIHHGGQLRQAAFGPDGGRIVTASSANTAQIWDAATGEAIGPPFQHPAQVLDATFSPDGRRLLTSCADGKARLWELLPFDASVDDLVRLSHVLSSQQVESSGANLERVDSATLRTAWEQIRGKYPTLFSIGP